MFVRRRPLLRAAVAGGGAYIAGKRNAQRSMGQQQERLANQGMSQVSPAAEPSGPSVSDQLAQLSGLHQQGSLSDAEFAAAKARLLGS